MTHLLDDIRKKLMECHGVLLLSLKSDYCINLWSISSLINRNTKSTVGVRLNPLIGAGDIQALR